MSDGDRDAAAPGPAPPRVPWERVLQRSWKPAAMLVLSAAAVAFLIWGFTHVELLFDYFLKPEAAEVRVAQRGPRTLSELAGVPGVGPTKLERYGEEVLAALAAA